MASIVVPLEATPAKHREFRRFLEKSSEKNLMRAFLEWQKSIDSDRSFRFFAARWNVDYSLVCMWAQPFDKPFRRPGANNRHVFDDLTALAGVTMDEYYRAAPPSRQKDAPALARRTRAAKKAIGRAGDIIVKRRGSSSLGSARSRKS